MNLKNEHIADLSERLKQVAVSLDDMTPNVDTDKVLVFELLVGHIKDIAGELNRRGEGA